MSGSPSSTSRCRVLKGVEVRGLREFSRSVRNADKALAVELRKGLNDIARVVADDARSAVPKRSGALAKSIRPTSTAKVGKISMGGARVPYAGFIEYGGSVGINDSVKRPFVRDGRHLKPAYEKNRAKVQKEMSDLLDRMIKTAGLD